jgi:hypothetical protein
MSLHLCDLGCVCVGLYCSEYTSLVSFLFLFSQRHAIADILGPPLSVDTCAAGVRLGSPVVQPQDRVPSSLQSLSWRPDVPTGRQRTSISSRRYCNMNVPWVMFAHLRRGLRLRRRAAAAPGGSEGGGDRLQLRRVVPARVHCHP